MEKLISVIVPVYKVEDYIGKCIESLIAQTYKNIEIILVDDGSPDSSGDICEEYAKKDNRIVVLHKENGGLSDARNYGLERAHGELIGFVDSDDYINENMYKILIDTMNKTNADIVISNLEEVAEGDMPSTIVEPQKEYTTKVMTNIQAQNVYYDRTDLRIAFTVAWNKLYKREVMGDIIYPKGYIHEDEFTTFKYLYNAKNIAFVDVPLYYYLRRDSGIMGSAFNIKKFNLLQAYEHRICFYEEKNEWELWKKGMKQYIHMTARINKWMKEAHASDDVEIEKSRQFYLKHYRENKNKCTLGAGAKIESFLFGMSFKLYYLIWNCIRG